MRPWSGCLCIGCLERRIGRKLLPRDFSSHDKKCWARLPSTERLRNRRGLKGRGPQEIVLELTPDHIYDWSEPELPSWEEASRAHPATPATPLEAYWEEERREPRAAAS
jgi:hypothetical protein